MSARGRLALLAAAACALWTAYLRLQFVGFSDDALYYLDPAMSFARGLGVVTKILYPAQIAAMRGDVALPAPFLWHGPLGPWAIGLVWRLLGFAAWAPLVYSFGLTLVTGLFAYALARDAANERAGLLAAGLYWTSTGVWDSNVGALTDPLFTALAAAAAWLLWRSRRGDAAKWCALAGVVLGLASGARLAGQVYWLGFFGAAWALHRRGKALLALAGGLAAGLVPLLLYNWVCGRMLLLSPGFYLLQASRSFPGVSAQTSYYGASSLQTLLAYPRDVLQKAVTGPLYGATSLLAHEGWLTVLMVAGLALRASTAEGERWRRLALWLCLPVFAANLVLANGGARYLQPLYPLALPLGASLLAERLSAARRPALLAALLAWAFLSPAALLAKDAWKTRAARERAQADLAALGAWLAGRTSPRDVVYTDDPPNVAWHAGRPAVHLGFTLEDTRRTMQRVPAAGILLTTLRLHSSDYDEAFRAAYREKSEVLGFSPCARFEAPTVSAVLLEPKGACK